MPYNLFPLVLAAALFIPWQSWAEPVRVLIDVRSTHSDGVYDMDTLAAMARRRGVRVLAFGEHDRFSIRFGIEPIPRILGYSMQHPSLYITGLASFFADLNHMRRRYPDMLFMAGTESVPGYQWTGFPFYNLTLHNADRHIIALGIERPEQVQALPSYKLHNIHGPSRFSLLFWCVLAGGVLIILLMRRKAFMALLFAVLFAAFLAGWRWMPPVDADADFIAAAHQEGLFVIWAHPGTLSGVRGGPMGVKLDTQPYSRRVFTDPTADAFAAIYGDTDNNTEPGGMWDRYMAGYMAGRHPAPIWGAAAGDFHGRTGTGKFLGDSVMDVWTEALTPAAILDALRAGHMAAWQLPGDRDLRIRELYLETGAGRRFPPGSQGAAHGPLLLVCALGEGAPGVVDGARAAGRLHAQVVVDGRVWSQAMVGPGHVLREVLRLAPGAHVIRVRIPNQGGVRMEANPFLLRVSGAGNE